jgi:hypothetical protein
MFSGVDAVLLAFENGSIFQQLHSSRKCLNPKDLLQRPLPLAKKRHHTCISPKHISDYWNPTAACNRAKPLT